MARPKGGEKDDFYKRSALKAAKGLGYSSEALAAIKKSKDDYEVARIMATERGKKR